MKLMENRYISVIEEVQSFERHVRIVMYVHKQLEGMDESSRNPW